MISVQGLNKTFRTKTVETKALNNISFDIEEGDFVTIEGPSGCGKSTLLSILSLLDQPCGGAYHLAGVNVADIGFNERLRVRNKHLGIVFQAFNLIASKSVLDNVLLPLSFQKPFDRSKAMAKAAEKLSLVGMDHRLDHFPDQLSGGQQQRVAIARALVCEPDIILADEPTGNLDSQNATKVIELFSRLNEEQGQTILMVTHDKALAGLAKRRLNLLDGCLT